jgi:hypothetical protein
MLCRRLPQVKIANIEKQFSWQCLRKGMFEPENKLSKVELILVERHWKFREGPLMALPCLQWR